ncbi:MAG TPA: MFS transporter [Anaerolineae bacterium]|nr:MFS transporter [Anaerolineae bacterium]HQI86740.1 MFS transporter [Anaerolineae bacterium]
MDETNWKRSFFTIWSGQAVSLLGSSLAGFALVWWLASMSKSATVLAGATLMMILPQVVLGPLMGALVDRWNRRIVMMAVDGGIALLSLGLAGLFWAGRARFGHVYVVMLLRAVGQVIHMLAMQAATPLMVPDRHLARVAGMNQTLQGGMNIVSPPLGALLVSVVPIEAVLLLDMATALVAVLPLCWIAIPAPRACTQPASTAGEAARKISVWGEMREGWRFVWGWPGLLIILALAATLNFFGVPALSFMPLLVTNHFQLGALELGWLQTAVGIGVVGGGLALSAWGGGRSRIVTMLSALVVQGVGVLLMGGAPANAFAIALVGNLLCGLARPVIDGLMFAILQSLVPSEMLGRVFSLMMSACAAMAPLGLLIAGPVVDRVGVQFWFMLTGVVTLAASVVGFLIPAVRYLEDKKVQSLVEVQRV